MELEAKAGAAKVAAAESKEVAFTPEPKNRYNRMEWAGAFGDVGTLIPFVVAYITIVKMPPSGFCSCSVSPLWHQGSITGRLSRSSP